MEVDGVDTQELPVDFLPISAAQRYSVLVTARNDTTSDWRVHAHMNPDMFDQVPDDLQLNVTSRISYSTEPQAFGPETIFDEFPYFDDLRLTPVLQEAMAPADVVHNLTVVFDTYADGQNHASFNGVSDTPLSREFTVAHSSYHTDCVCHAEYADAADADEHGAERK